MNINKNGKIEEVLRTIINKEMTDDTNTNEWIADEFKNTMTERRKPKKRMNSIKRQ